MRDSEGLSFQVEYGCQPDSSRLGTAQAGLSPARQTHCWGEIVMIPGMLDCAASATGARTIAIAVAKIGLRMQHLCWREGERDDGDVILLPKCPRSICDLLG